MSIAERIPTAKEELFGFSLEWAMVDSTLMEKRIKPWINKKIIEYIGEEEASLVEYICQKVRAHSMSINELLICGFVSESEIAKGLNE